MKRIAASLLILVTSTFGLSMQSHAIYKISHEHFDENTKISNVKIKLTKMGLSPEAITSLSAHPCEDGRLILSKDTRIKIKGLILPITNPLCWLKADKLGSSIDFLSNGIWRFAIRARPQNLDQPLIVRIYAADILTSLGRGTTNSSSLIKTAKELLERTASGPLSNEEIVEFYSQLKDDW